MVKLIVGLANPGDKYYYTRHNVGSWYVRLLATWLRVSLQKETKFIGYASHVNISGSEVHLLIPDIFVNSSGNSVIAMAAFYCINPNEILIAHDDLAILPGVAKFKFGGGHGGHNGLKDIINKFDNDSNFYRLRVGIGHPGDKRKVIDFVLGNTLPSERKLINLALNEAVYCTNIWFQKGFMQAINRLHAFKAQTSHK